MDAAPPQPASWDMNLLKREVVCLQCDKSKQLVCPPCESGTQCQFISPTTCTECPYATCVPSTPLPATDAPASSNRSTNVGAIAGGVVGGLAFLAIMTYLVWRFCVRTRRQAIATEAWDEGQDDDIAGEKAYARSRASAQTRHSIASTVLTRASNIIQIAYIPGVTNRAAPSPSVLVPPVPPMPSGLSPAGTPRTTDDEHFFVPGDLRDSTYSGFSGFSDRTSFARTSYAPRSSVASTIYGKSAVIVAPAQTGMRAKPAMVSVRSAHSNHSSGTATPPVPAVDYDKYNLARPPSPAGSTFSVGSTFLNNASTATAVPARAMVVRVGSVKKTNAKKAAAAASTTTESESPTVRDSSTPTIIVDAPSDPFHDPIPSASQSTTSLSAVIEEATRRASQRDSTQPEKGNRAKSPFGDEHATS